MILPSGDFKGVEILRDEEAFEQRLLAGNNSVTLAWKNQTCSKYETIAGKAAGRKSPFDYKAGDKVLVSSGSLRGDFDGTTCPVLAYSSEEVLVRSVYGERKIQLPWLESSFAAVDVELAKADSAQSQRLCIVQHHLYCTRNGDIAKTLTELHQLIGATAASLKEANPRTSRDCKHWLGQLESINLAGYKLINSTQADFKGISGSGALNMRYLLQRYVEQRPKDFPFLLGNLLWARGFYAFREACSFSVSPLSAATVHKSQGSEYKQCLLVVPEPNDNQQNLLTREILYTAITRAKKGFYLFSGVSEIEVMVENKTERMSGLCRLSVVQ